MEAIIWGDTPRDLPEFSALIPARDNTALSHLFPPSLSQSERGTNSETGGAAVTKVLISWKSSLPGFYFSAPLLCHHLLFAASAVCSLHLMWFITQNRS